LRHEIPCAWNRSKIVPLGGRYAVREASDVLTLPEAVPAMRKRRFGYVCASTEPNQRSDNGNVLASA
jgi:hypothetical protein